MFDKTTRPRALELAAVVLANLLPLLGVLFGDWSVAALLVVYWVELGGLLFWGTVKALLARRPPAHSEDMLLAGATRHKRGRISLPFTSHSILVAPIPAIAVAVPFLGFLWLIIGAGVMGFAAAAVGDAVAPDRFHRTVWFGAGGIVLSQGVSTFAAYGLRDRADEVNAQMALRSALWPIAVVGSALAVGTASASSATAGVSVLVLVIGAKFLLDIAGVYRDRLRDFEERTSLDFGWAYEPPEWSPVDASLGDPVETVRPHPVAVLASGIPRGLGTGAVVFPGILLFGCLLSLASGSTRLATAVGSIGGLFLAVLALAGVCHRALEHLAMEYRVGGDVVGYDRLLDEPQWRLPEWKVNRADPTQTVTDRVFGTETLAVEHEGRSIRLVHLDDAAAVQSSSAGKSS